MRLTISGIARIVAVLCIAPLNASDKPATTVPRLVRLNGSFHPANSLPVGPIEGATLSIYNEEQGGVPLWQETQNVSLNSNGQYTALLGITQKDGIPVDFFFATEPRWLGVQFNRPGEVEQPRVQLVSMPYALKVLDAETLAGKPASAYLLSPTAGTTDTGSDGFTSTGVGTTTPGSTLDVAWDINMSGKLLYNGRPILYVPSGGKGNTDTGYQGLFNNTRGGLNTAAGSQALYSDTTEYGNTATGVGALANNTTGNNNTATGLEALVNNTTGNNNIAIGFEAASNVSGTNSNNIHIGTLGASADNGIIRIGGNTSLGDPAAQTQFFVVGVNGVQTGMNNSVPVLIDSNGQLGTMNSSRRYKEDIQDMGDVSNGLMRLRPVTFRYQKPFADGSKPIQYGLIAEEVAEVYPDLVAHSANGQIETVKYQVLDSMLLNEVQRQERVIAEQKSEIAAQKDEIRILEDRLSRLEAAMASVATRAGVQ